MITLRLLMSSSRHLLFNVTCLAAVASCLGCGKGRAPLYPVRGQVLVQGKPAVNAVVAFHPVGGGPDAVHSVGHVDEQGNFTLTTYDRDDGAPEGEYQVTVTWFRAVPVAFGTSTNTATSWPTATLALRRRSCTRPSLGETTSWSRSN